MCRLIAEEFARYGVAVIKSWIGKRTIHGRVKAGLVSADPLPGRLAQLRARR